MILYLYPEEWTGCRAREVHTLSTCVALARTGSPVTLVTAGGEAELTAHLRDLAGEERVAGLEIVALSRNLGPIRSAAIFSYNFGRWLRKHGPFAQGFTIHLKAAAILHRAGVPYLFEAHEIFAETRRANEEVQRMLEEMERSALADAAWRVATSSALAAALRERYSLPNDFAIVPNAGQAPLVESVAKAEGPLIYCGSIADWKGIELAIEGARLAGIPLRIVGGSESEWHALGGSCDTRGLEWSARVSLTELPTVLAGARGGVISTQAETGSGRYSCPMKLFDYARCGLPVISTALPALQSLDLGAWCSLVKQPTVEAWADAFRAFLFDPVQSDAARQWATSHTWEARAHQIAAVLARP